MTLKPSSPVYLPILNPRYEGATVEDVARALLRQRGPRSDDWESDSTPCAEAEAA